MTFDPFHVDLHGVLEMSRLHAGIVAALDESMGSATATGAGDVYGSIGAGRLEHSAKCSTPVAQR